MKVRIHHSRWLAQLLVAGALSLALAPQPASAHGGHDHASGPASQSADDRAAVDRGIGSRSSHAWSPSCPESPGNACCCGGLTASPGGAKIALVNASGWGVLVLPPARGLAQALPGNEPLSLLPPSLVLPRAPPFFS